MSRSLEGGENSATSSSLNSLQDTPNRVTVAAIVVIRRSHIRGLDVQEVHTVVIGPSRGPEVADGTLILRRPIVEAPGKRRR